MGIKAHFKGNIDAAFNRFLAAIDEEIIDRLCRIGEEVVTYAKQIPPERGFTDRPNREPTLFYWLRRLQGRPADKLSF